MFFNASNANLHAMIVFRQPIALHAKISQTFFIMGSV